MTLVLHQSWKDLRQHRLLLLAWLSVIFLQTLLASVPFDLLAPFDAHFRSAAASTVAALGSVLGTLHFALAVVLAVVIVHGDSPAGTTAFWFTRPLTGRAMLASKLVTAGLVLALVPALADAAAVAANRLPWTDAARAAEFGALEHLVVVLPVMAVAAVTLDLAGFALAGLGVVLALGAWLVVLQIAVRSRTLAGLQEAPAVYQALVLGALASLLVLAVQYFLRARRASVALLLACAFALTLLVRCWTTAAGERFDQARSLPRGAVVLALDSAGEPEIRVIPLISGDADVEGKLAVTVATPDIALEIAGIDARLDVPGESTVRTQERWRAPERSAFAPLENVRSRLAAAAALRPTRVLWNWPGSDGTPVRAQLLAVGRNERERMMRSGVRYAADIFLRATRFSPMEPVPLHRGAGGFAGGRRFAVLHADCDHEGCTVLLREAAARFAPEAVPRINTDYLLVNNRLGLALENLAPPGTRSVLSKALYLPTGTHLTVAHRVLRFEAPTGAGATVTRDWLRECSIVPLVARDEGLLRGSLAIPDFGSLLQRAEQRQANLKAPVESRQ